MRRRSFLINTAGFAAAVAGGFWLKDNVLWRKPTLTFSDLAPWVELETAGLPLPVISVKVAGQDLLALIDTGAQYSVIDRGFADELTAKGLMAKTFDMPMVAYGVGGQAQVGRGTTLQVEMAGLAIDKLRTAILELGPLAQVQGLGVGLIIGRDILSEVVLDLDLKRQRIRMQDPQNWKQAADLLPMTASKILGDAMALDVSVEGAVIRAVLDTGASSLLSLSEAAAQEAGILDGREEQSGESLVLGGVSTARWVKVDTVTVADVLSRNVRLPVYADSNLPNYPDALIGITAFERRKLAIDLGRGRLYVEGQLDLTIG